MMLRLFVFSILFIHVFTGSTRQRDLSDATHHADAEVHDLKYDQEAFLGKAEAEKYKELTPEESKRRLRLLVEKKVDANKDGRVSESELRDWIKYISRKWLLEERDRAWHDYNPSNKTKFDFDSYVEVYFGGKIEERYQGDELKRVLKDLELDRKKWNFADENRDGFLDIEEFFAFVRPEEANHMKPFLIDEMLARADKNKDGYIDINEYTDELWTREPNAARNKDPEPSWITNEIKHFPIHRDTSKDGKMDRTEIGEWIMPEKYDGVEAETHHLMAHADKNKDSFLSLEEIEEHSELFAGSQATNYGDTLKKEEL